MNDKTWDRLTGLMLGATVGFIAGILLAPSKGTDTRDVIKRRTQGTLSQVSGSVRDIRDNLSKKAQDLWRRGVTEIPVADESAQNADNPEVPTNS
jgi:gas vesicle protein